MADHSEPLDEANDSEALLPVTSLLQLNAPLVAAVDVAPSAHGAGETSQPPAPVTVTAASSIDEDLDRHLHGEHQTLGQAELRRAALLRLIGLGRFASRPQPN